MSSERDFIEAIQNFDGMTAQGRYDKQIEVNFLSQAERNSQIPAAYTHRNGTLIDTDANTVDSFVQNLMWIMSKKERPQVTARAICVLQQYIEHDSKVFRAFSLDAKTAKQLNFDKYFTETEFLQDDQTQAIIMDFMQHILDT